MIWNDHFELKGKHARFSPSTVSWINYDEEKAMQYIRSQEAKELGTELHAFADLCVSKNIRLPKQKNRLLEHIRMFMATKLSCAKSIEEISYYTRMLNLVPGIAERILITLTEYVNDGISFGMKSEVTLKYSDDIFGTADTIIFRDNTLHIHDLKTGEIPGKMKQLDIYAALFCLEYKMKPNAIKIVCAIYQNGEKVINEPAPEDILGIMQRIVSINNTAVKMKQEGYD